VEYLSIEQARQRGGLRLVLTTGVPGPWGEAAKAVFQAKGIAFAPVRQDGGGSNPELLEWTGCENAPQAILDDERGRDGWAEIVALAERLEPDPPLLPDDPRERALAFGLSHEICGEMGFGWCRRLMMFAPTPNSSDDASEGQRRMRQMYSDTTELAVAERRVREILEMLAARLHAGRERGSRYLIGDRLCMTDLHWAAFAGMVQLAPSERCPAPDFIRGIYDLEGSPMWQHVDPILLEHRDFIYDEHLVLPQEF
jgi:glutathione S-transferase